MIDHLARYVYEIYQCKSVSAAAEKLYLSQPALSASLKKAEAELGAPIFNRKTLPFTLTPEGKLYIEALEQMLQIEERTRKHIQELRELKSGTLKIGSSTHLSYYFIPQICRSFRSRYPQIDISITLEDTEHLPGMLERKEVDVIFLSTEIARPDIRVETLFEEKFVVTLRKDHPGISHLLPYAVSYQEIVSRTCPADKLLTDLTLFHELEFIYSPPGSNISKKRKRLFGELGTTPYITASASRHLLNYNLMKAGIGALFTTDAALATMPPDNRCYYFALSGPTAKQNYSVAYRTGEAAYTDRIVQEFVHTAKQFFSGRSPLEALQTDTAEHPAPITEEESSHDQNP